MVIQLLVVTKRNKTVIVARTEYKAVDDKSEIVGLVAQGTPFEKEGPCPRPRRGEERDDKSAIRPVLRIK